MKPKTYEMERLWLKVKYIVPFAWKKIEEDSEKP
jgi:hypothetical protein